MKLYDKKIVLFYSSCGFYTAILILVKRMEYFLWAQEKEI